MYFLRNDLPYNRFAVSVSRKVAGAVGRNAMKRRMRELYRQQDKSLPAAHDIWVSIRSPFYRNDRQRVKELFQQAWQKIARQQV